MLTLLKAAKRLYTRLSVQLRAVKRCWLVMTDTERRALLMRGMSVATCAMAVTVAMPVLADRYEIEVQEADARLRANLFAELGDAGAAMRADPTAPSLVQHPWIVNMEDSFQRPDQAVLSPYASRSRDMAALTALADFDPVSLKQADTLAAEHQCLSEAVYYEARSETTSGQLAVAEVVANRMRDHRYPNSICDVVYQGATRTTGCQFTFTCDGAMALKPRGERWEKAQAVAAQVIMDVHEPRTGAATHYHATYVDPVWNSGLVRTEKIGLHIFYRFPRGREWADARARLDARRAREARARIQTVSADFTAPNAQALGVIQTASSQSDATAAP